MTEDERAGSADQCARAASGRERSGVFASFSILSYRYQWCSDVFSVWGAEMETIILGWYVLVQTDSAFLTSLIAALRFGGTLLAPAVGVLADRMPRRSLLIAIRLGYLLLACSLAVPAWLQMLPMPWVFVVAALAGLLRPSEMIVRQSLIADTVPRELLANALGFGRTTMEAARIAGALAGAALLSSLGIGLAYAVVSLAYLLSVCLSVPITAPKPRQGAASSRALEELVEGVKHIRGSPVLVTAMALAFMVNLTGFPITLGLLPIIARDHFGLDENGLAQMSATVAAGTLVGALLVAVAMRGVSASRIMLAGLAIWHVLILLFAGLDSPAAAFVCLAAIGLAAGFAMVPMAVVIMSTSPPAFRGRVMGVRMLAVYGLPLGLLLGGALIEWLGIGATVYLFGAVGLLPVMAAAGRLSTP